MLTSSGRYDRREKLIYNKRFRLGLWVTKGKRIYLESCHITKLASFHSGHQQHSETLSLISPRQSSLQNRSESHEAAHYVKVHEYSLCSTLLWIQATTLSQQTAASLCFISYDVQFHVLGVTDIFVTAPSIQAFKSSDLHAQMDVNNLITFISTHIPHFTSLWFTQFCFNAPCQFTPLLNFRSLSFSLRSFKWLRSIMLTPYYRCGHNMWFSPLWCTPTFSGKQLGYTTRAGCIKNTEGEHLVDRQGVEFITCDELCNSCFPPNFIRIRGWDGWGKQYLWEEQEIWTKF